LGKDFEPEALQLIAGYMDVYSLNAGDVIFNQGEESSYLCIISRGRVNIVKTDSDGSEKTIATVGPGQPLGELSLFDAEPRSATAIAAAPVEMLLLDAFGFELLFEKYPRVWGKLVYPIVKTISKRLRQTSGILADYLKY
jgi:CRP-like cAMP-binding protein